MFTDFPRQQYLGKIKQNLRYTYISCIVNTKNNNAFFRQMLLKQLRKFVHLLKVAFKTRKRPEQWKNCAKTIPAPATLLSATNPWDGTKAVWMIGRD